MMLRIMWTMIMATCIASPTVAQENEACQTANTVVNLGWDRFRDSDFAEARELFVQALDACPQHIGAMVGRGFADLRLGNLGAADSSFQSVLSRDSSDVDAWVGFGVVARQRDEFEQARARYNRALRLDPGNSEAQAYLDELDRATTEPARVVDSTVLLAEWLAIADQFTRAEQFASAAAVYDTIVQAFPSNNDARRSLARVLGWGGEYDSSIVVYDGLLVDNPNDIEARKGLARTRGWSGDLSAAEREWLVVVAADPDDGEGQLGLAQVRRWAGRLEAADTALTNAERLMPSDPLVRQERLALQQMRAATTDPFLIFETDSDGNDITTFLVAAGARVMPRLFLTGRLIFRSAHNTNLAAADFTSTTAALDGTYDLNTRWSLRAGLGVNTTSGAAENRLIVRAGATGPAWRGTTPTFDYRREPLDVTAQLIANGVYYDELAIGGYASPSAWTVSGSYGLALFHGSESNTRHLLSGLALRPVWQDFSTGGRLRIFSFAKNLNDGYFDPSLYILAEVPVQWTGQLGKWVLFGELNPGFQLIDTETSDVNTQLTIGGNARVTYAIARGREVGVMALASRSGLQTLATPVDGYRYYMIGAFGSWSF